MIDAPALDAGSRLAPGLRRGYRVCLYGLAGFCATVGLALVLPLPFGYQAFTIVSGSMEPAIGTGDVVVVERIAPLEARPGDVVSFRDPEDPSRIITHRVAKISTSQGTVRFVTRGDANTGVEKWGIQADGTIGRVAYRVPKIGYAANRIGSPFGRLGFIVLPAVLLGLSELWRIWRPAPSRERHAQGH